MASFEHVGAALAQLRKRAGISQEQLAEKLGLRGSTSVSSIETGNPRADTIARYLGAIGYGPRDLADALDALTYDSRPTPSEVRESAPPPDPLDEKVKALIDSLQEMVAEVKSRDRKP